MKNEWVWDKRRWKMNDYGIKEWVWDMRRWNKEWVLDKRRWKKNYLVNMESILGFD